MKRLISKFMSLTLLFIIIFSPLSKISALSYTPIKIGETKNLKVSGTAVYESSNPSVLSINQKGIAKAKNLGFAVVIITSSKGIYKQTFKVVEKYPSIVVEDTIDVDAPKIKLNKTTLYISPVDRVYLKVLNTKKTVKWSSSNPNVAKVNSKGAVDGYKVGTTIITAKVGNKTLKCKVNVLNQDCWYNEYDESLSEKENAYNLYLMKISKTKYKIVLGTVDSKGNAIYSGDMFGTVKNGRILFEKQGKYKLTGGIKVDNKNGFCVLIVDGNSKFNISTIFWTKIG